MSDSSAAEYVLVETQEPGGILADALTLREQGHPVRVYLVQDAVHGAGSSVEALMDAGCVVLADDFSLAQRGLTPDDLTPSTRVASMAELAAELLDPAVRAVWH